MAMASLGCQEHPHDMLFAIAAGLARTTCASCRARAAPMRRMTRGNAYAGAGDGVPSAATGFGVMQTHDRFPCTARCSGLCLFPRWKAR
jgi:hypothetical protein